MIDGLMAMMILSVLILMVMSSISSLSNTKMILHEQMEKCEEEYIERLRQIPACENCEIEMES